MPVTPELSSLNLDLGDLLKMRADLFAARMAGTLSYRDQNGEEVSYKSDLQMASALAALDREIAKHSGRGTPTTLHFQTSKGL
jgi:hypothetical protein